MFGLGVYTSASLFYSSSIPQSSLPSPPHVFFSPGQRGNILNTISFYGLIKPLEGKSERDGEVERWGTEGPV